MNKSAEAFRTIGEVADELGVPKHVLRFWEGKFPQIRPMKRGGGRRYYRPEDLELLRGIRHLLHAEGYTIKGVQKILREQGIDQVKSASRAALAAAKAEGGKKKRGRAPAPTAESPAPSAIESKAAAKTASVKDVIAAAVRELEAVRSLLTGSSTMDGDVAVKKSRAAR
ncbi:MAG: MerR family transcriptional regulator [Hyphomicrobium sp.]